MVVLKVANLALAFVLELCGLAAFAYWGATTGEHVATRVGLAVGVPLVGATAWGLFVSPKRRVDRPVLRWAVELLFFGGAIVALAAAGQVVLAVVLALARLVNRVLIIVWHQQD